MFYDFKYEKEFIAALESIGINLEILFKEAGIPHRAMSNENFSISEDQYKDLLCAFDKLVDKEKLVQFSTIDYAASFVPEFFAGLCADNGLNCIKRVAKYKKIIAPVHMLVETDETTTSIEYVYSDSTSLPPSMHMNGHISILSIIRQGTAIRNLSPIKILSSFDYPDTASEYFGIKSEISKESKIIFDNKDLKKHFITENNRMWEYLEKELDERLKEMETDSSFSALVRKTLFELLASGVSDMEKIAFELGMSTRTLQRRLADENTTFKKQLNHTRELLVRGYLKTDMALDEISFLVNYLDTKSLSRAFKTWTGMSITEYRRQNAV